MIAADYRFRAGFDAGHTGAPTGFRAFGIA